MPPPPPENPTRPTADDWDGPYYRPTMCAEYFQKEWHAKQLLTLNAMSTQGCWHYTVSGFGIYRCGSQRQVLDEGNLLAYRAPDRGMICHDKRGLPWHTVCIHVSDTAAMTMFDHIIGKFGMFQHLPNDCTAVKLAQKLARATAEKPHRDPHFWSQLTFEWLDAWWVCAEKYSGLVSDALREPPHDSRLLSAGAGNVKNMAAQFGYSRSYLSRKLHSQWGRPPSVVLREARMLEASRMLRTSVLSIGDIGAKLGFSSSSAFTRSFKQAQGVGPAEYRRRNGND